MTALATYSRLLDAVTALGLISANASADDVEELLESMDAGPGDDDDYSEDTRCPECGETASEDYCPECHPDIEDEYSHPPTDEDRKARETWQEGS